MTPPTKFALGMFEDGSHRFPGMVLGEPWSEVVPLGPPFPEAMRRGYDTVDAMLADWGLLLPVLETIAHRVSADDSRVTRRQLSELRILPPVAPRQILQAGANYRKHVVDLMVAQKTLWPEGMSEVDFRDLATRLMDTRATKAPPYIFSGLPSAITGPYDEVILPRIGSEHDWELELAVVIGRPAYQVARSEAERYIAGYMIANDVTTRDRVYRPDLPSIGTDWLCAKNAPTFLPIGPFLVPSRVVPHASNLRITLRLNGEVMQDDTTADMLYDIPRLIEHATSTVRLYPGDLLLTGSPAGNGAHYGRFLRPGDEMEGAIEGIGTIRNRCVERTR